MVSLTQTFLACPLCLVLQASTRITTMERQQCCNALTMLVRGDVEKPVFVRRLKNLSSYRKTGSTSSKLSPGEIRPWDATAFPVRASGCLLQVLRCRFDLELTAPCTAVSCPVGTILYTDGQCYSCPPGNASPGGTTPGMLKWHFKRKEASMTEFLLLQPARLVNLKPMSTSMPINQLASATPAMGNSRVIPACHV